MEYSKFTYGDLIEKASSKALVLPNFQRKFVWKLDEQRDLLASFIVNLPIGSFLILEGEKGDFVSKELCFREDIISPKSECLYLLDGQQRLSSLKNFFSDHLNKESWEKQWNRLHPQLRYRWFLSISEGADILGLDNLRFRTEYEHHNGSKDILPKLATLEPTDVIDSIKYYNILKTKGKENFYHPGAKTESTSSYDQELDFAMQCVVNKEIPLFDFLTDNKNIVKHTLKRIAENQADSLQAKVWKNTKLAKDYLGHLDDQIEEKYDQNKTSQIKSRWETLKSRWIEDILDYFKDLFKSEIMVPVVKSTELARATSVFEYMNKGGTPLDSFDIMVAKFAGIGDEKTLYDLLEESISADYVIPYALSELSSDNHKKYSPVNFGIIKNDIIAKPIKEQFLNLISIFDKIKKEGVSELDIEDIKKRRILSLSKEDIEDQAKNTLKALVRALAFLQYRCGIDNFNRLSYKLMLIPIATILEEDKAWEDLATHRKLEFWYWTSLFSGYYREKQNQRCISDSQELFNWIVTNKIPDFAQKRLNNVFEETNYSDLQTLLLKSEDRSVPKAISNGILQYILSLRPNDFTNEDEKLYAWKGSDIDLTDHHIIPLGSVTSLGQSSKELRKDKSHILNSPLNRTLISKQANAKIRDLSLEKYLPELNKAVNYSHLLDSSFLEGKELNSWDNKFYEDFLKKRFEKIKIQLLNELRGLKE